MKGYLFLPFTIVRLQVSVLTVGLGPTSGEPLWSLPTKEGRLPIGYPHCEVGMGVGGGLSHFGYVYLRSSNRQRPRPSCTVHYEESGPWTIAIGGVGQRLDRNPHQGGAIQRRSPPPTT